MGISSLKCGEKTVENGEKTVAENGWCLPSGRGEPALIC
jgi:hypothetical protein